MGVEAAAEETPSLTGEFVGETHRGLECTQAYPPGTQHQKGPLCLWVAEGVTEIWQSGASHCYLSAPPPLQRHSTATSVTPPPVKT